LYESSTSRAARDETLEWIRKVKVRRKDLNIIPMNTGRVANLSKNQFDEP
jgi:hypothetical protein